MSFKLDLPAPRVPMFAGNGTMNPVWYRFFTGVSKRLGVSTTDLIESAKEEAEQAVSVAQQAAELAAQAVQSGDNVSELVNDAGYLTSVLWGDIGGALADQADLQTALNGKEDAFGKNTAFNKDFGVTAGTVVEGSQLANYQLLSEKGQASGYAELDGGGKVPAGQLPSYVDDVEEYADFASFPATGEAGKIYIDLTEGDIYRWTGSAYAKINDAVSQADQALKWSSPITLALGTDLTGNVSFDGSGNVTLNATVNNDSHNHTLSTITDAGTAASKDVGESSGNVMQVGAFGLGLTPSSDFTGDLDDLRTPGLYGIYAVNISANGPSFLSSVRTATVTVAARSGGYVSQLAICTRGDIGATEVRAYDFSTNTWGAWRVVA